MAILRELTVVRFCQQTLFSRHPEHLFRSRHPTGPWPWCTSPWIAPEVGGWRSKLLNKRVRVRRKSHEPPAAAEPRILAGSGVRPCGSRWGTASCISCTHFLVSWHSPSCCTNTHGKTHQVPSQCSLQWHGSSSSEVLRGCVQDLFALYRQGRLTSLCSARGVQMDEWWMHH